MSVVIYTCDTCKRDIEIVEKDTVLSLIQNCIITQNCKGSLYKTGVRPNGVMGKPTPVVEGLEDYSKRGRLYVHEQLLPSSSWVINHNLNTNPIVYAYLKAVDGKYKQLDQDQYVVTIDNQDTIVVEFAEKSIGIVHVVARPNVEQPLVTVSDVTTNQASANTIWTIATPVLGYDDELIQSYAVTFTAPSTSQTTTVNIPFTAHKKDTSIALFDSPWRNAQLIIWNDILYRVRSVRITNILSANPIENKSPFYFVDAPDILILTSKSPYESDTDMANEVVYVPDMPRNAFTRNRVSDSELYVETRMITDIFPTLQVYRTISQ